METDRTPPKRMRLGTRSCTECRRRKVRCVFQEGSTSCVACTLHSVPCQAQQGAVPSARITSANNEHNGPARSEEHGKDGTSLSLLKKLDEMERMIKQIRGRSDNSQTTGASNTAGSTSLPSSNASGSDVFGETERVRQPSTSTSTTGTTPSSMPNTGYANASTDRSGIEISNSSATDALDSFGNTPLVSLFRDALRLPHGQPEPTSPTSQSNGPALLQQSFVPGFSPKKLLSDACLLAVIEATTICFAVFPPCSFFKPPETAPHSITPPTLNTSDASAIAADIRAAIWSDNADAAARALLWTALCIFDLPRSWTGQYAELSSGNTQTLIDMYRRQATRMLSASSENGDCTRHGIEARCLLVKLSVDLGLPRKAWLAARKAVGDCLLLGYHRAARQDKPHEQILWHLAVHTERETCMILGMPSSISNHTACLLPTLPADELKIIPAFRLLHEMTSLLGSVTDHYQIIMAPPPPGSFPVITDNLGPNYPKTIELDQAWEACRRVMPADFWKDDSSSIMSTTLKGMAPVDLFIRQTTKLRYYIIGRHIHLPYALKANKDRRYAYSRTACLEASRGIISAYQALRIHGSAEWSPCGMLDFESFSAAMVLALVILQDSSDSGRQGPRQRTQQEEDDYCMLVELSLAFRKAHLLKGSCTVAQRAADVMDIILPILQGQYRRLARADSGNATTADHDIHIPFFGRLRVTFPRTEPTSSPRHSLSSPSTSLAHLSDDMDVSYATQSAQSAQTSLYDTPLVPPTIEFGVPFCNQEFHYNFDFNLELNADWMNPVDMGIYDWTTMMAPGPM